MSDDPVGGHARRPAERPAPGTGRPAHGRGLGRRRFSLIELVLICLPLIQIGTLEARDEAPPTLDDLLRRKVSVASKHEETALEAPGSVTIVTAEEIEELGFQTLAELLGSVRGFYLSYDRNYDYVGIRGFSRPTDFNDRVLLLMDGHAVNENTYGTAPIGSDFPIALSAVDHVEIVRGPGAALYGTYAMLAVVNVVSKAGAATDGLQVSAEAGSFGRKGATVSWGKAFASGLDLAASANFLDEDGQDLYFPEYADQGDGVARGVDGDRAVGALFSARVGSSSLRGGLTWRRKQIPTGAYDVTFGDPRARTVDERQWLDLSHDFVLAFDKTLTVRAYADHYGYRGVYPSEVVLRDETKGIWAGSEARLTWDVRSGNRLMVGAEYRYNFRSTYALQSDAETTVDSDVHSSILSLYVQDQLQLARTLVLTLGLRHDAFSIAGSATSPRAALVWAFSPSGAVKVLYGEAFRAPNTYENLYAGTSDDGKLDAETIRTFEVNLEKRVLPWLFGTASAYRYEMKDLIDGVTGASGEFLYINRSRVSTTGLELGFDARLPRGLHATASYSFQAPHDDDGDEDARWNVPRHVFKGTLAGDLFGVVHAAALVRWESARLTVYGVETSSSFVTDLNLTSRPIPHLLLSLAIRNIFDERYATPGGFEHREPAIPQDGRNVVARATWSF